jgi:hypothetical protein
MGNTMPGELKISADWERLDEGSPEERACFAALGIRFKNISLTEGADPFVNRVRAEPLLSAYHLAEWIAWNWWRLRWEPRSNADDWAFAHRMSTVGGGYVWPNITIFSDGQRIALIAKPTMGQPSAPYRYLSNIAAVVSASEFENAIDQFVEQVTGQLRAEGLAEGNLDRIWRDVTDERRDPDSTRRRKLEALLGSEPDRADQSSIERLVADAETLGQPAMNEIAADHGRRGGAVLTAATLRETAASVGFDASLRNVVSLRPGSALPRSGDVPAWLLGSTAAKALREQERLGSGPISNDRLAELIGVQTGALTARGLGSEISFAIDDRALAGRVVLRSKWETNRRFELARLLGERIIAPTGGKLFPATRAYTYRQKMQRSFAAELLSPFEAVDEMLAGDYSSENQHEVAEHFGVSDMTILTLLVNHRRLEREELDSELDFSVA